MMNMVDPNTKQPMFKVLKVGLACEACQAAGISSECTHSKFGLPIYPLHSSARAHHLFFSLSPFVAVESFRPPWKSASKVSFFRHAFRFLLSVSHRFFALFSLCLSLYLFFLFQFAMVKQIYSTQKGMFERGKYNFHFQLC